MLSLLGSGEYQRSTLFLGGKFADYKRQQTNRHVVDIPQASQAGSALPQLALKQSNKDDWRQLKGEGYGGSRDLLKRMGGRRQEEEEEDVEAAQGRMAEDGAAEDEETEYEDYVEDDGNKLEH